MNMVFYLWEIFIFIFLLFWLILLPGYFLVEKFKIPLSKIEKFTISMAIGVSGFTLLLYIFGSLNVRFLAYAVISVISFLQLSSYRRYPDVASWYRRAMNSGNIFSLLLIIFGTFILGSIMLRSGWQQNGGLSFTEYRDAFWHLGLMKELVRQIPPVHPGFAPLPLTNYHYFTHLFGAGFLALNIFNSLDFYFRLFPFFLTLFYGLSLYVVGRALSKTVLGGNLSVLFGYFTGSFAYILPLFIKYPGFNWQESSFWLSQPFSLVINPPFALSASLFLVSAFLLIKITSEQKNNLVLPLILVAGTIISFKVYAGVLVLGGLLISGVWYFWQKRNLNLLIGAVLATILSFLLFIPINGKDAGSFLVFSPGWFLRSMVESSDRVQIIDWILRENTYAAAGNVLAILRYRFVELLIYLAGNLGIRIFGFIIVIKIIKNIFRESVINIFLLAVAFVGFMIPLLFVQSGSIANTVQFSYYSLIIFSLWLAIFLDKMMQNKTIMVKTIIIGTILLLAIPTSVKLWYGIVVKSLPIGVDRTQVEAFTFLQKNTRHDDIILVPGTYRYTESLIAGTLSDRRLYYSDRLMAENTHKDFKTREVNLQRFYSSNDTGWNTSFLKDNHIAYVFVDKIVISDFNLQYYPLEKVFGNKTIDIYKVF